MKTKEKNLCMECEVRGKCCHFSTMIDGYNVILPNQPCEFLNKTTGLCNDYENRKSNKKYCLDIKENGYGSLPEKCSYLKENPELELNPKIDIQNIGDKLSQKGIFSYNILNNINNIEQYYGKPILKGDIS